MSSENRIRRLQIKCPNASSIENLLLRSRKHPVAFRAFEQHMVVCRRCQRIVKRITIFYNILEKEIGRPQSPKVIRFAEDIKARVQRR